MLAHFQGAIDSIEQEQFSKAVSFGRTMSCQSAKKSGWKRRIFGKSSRNLNRYLVELNGILRERVVPKNCLAIPGGNIHDGSFFLYILRGLFLDVPVKGFDAAQKSRSVMRTERLKS